MTCWVVVPAAGTGQRVGGSIPKQYQLLQGRPLIEHTLQRLLAIAPRAIIVAIGENDSHWGHLRITGDTRIRAVAGGAQRADSVRLALNTLAEEAREDDWVLVHDAVRPCVTMDDITLLRTALQNNPVGGLLAVPVNDTVKRLRDAQTSVSAAVDSAVVDSAVVNSAVVDRTISREGLWLAQTPQLFRFGILRAALENAKTGRCGTTDEAAAVEQLGYHPLVIRGRRDNIKITEPEDFAIAAAILDYQRKEGGRD